MGQARNQNALAKPYSLARRRKSYIPPAGGADRDAPRTLREILDCGLAQFGDCAFSFLFHFFLFSFHFCLFFILL
jgi:hypothetical protein